jgi:protoporphyrinogen oxidase
MTTTETTIIGAGPAGLACAYELARRGRRALVLERADQVGGISRTVSLGRFRFDLGGHRFYTSRPEVEALWREVLDDEFVVRPRLSRIHYRHQFFDYPLRLVPTLRKLGVGPSLAVLGSYLAAHLHPYPHPANFEEWVVNAFGRRLYETFFRSYSEKIWGMRCTEMSADWAGARIKGLSLREVLRAALGRNRAQQQGLYDEFLYPPLGPSMVWDRLVEQLGERGGEVRRQAAVTRLEHDGRRITGVCTPRERLPVGPGAVVSSLPLRELLLALDPAPPAEVLAAARRLRYRGFLTVAVVLPEPNPFPDDWLYIHAPEVQVGRIQNAANWSPALVPDPNSTVLGLEYFCWEGDDLWNASDADLTALAARELEVLGLRHGLPVADSRVVREAYAYPLYDQGYQAVLATCRSYLAGLENLQIIGRNGVHVYSNMSHAMMTGLLAARNLMGEQHDLWNVTPE